jgi:diguanylate cyclase (GGDEF)-like protein
VVSVVFVVSMVNLVVGFALALALERHIVLYVPQFRAKTAPSGALAASRQPEEAASTAALPQVLQHVPDKWIALLEQTNAEYHTFTEASVHVLKLEVSTYRNDLLDIEDLVRSAVAKQNPDAIHDAVEELVALNEEWVTRQRDAVSIIAEKREELGAYADLGNHLEAILLDQSKTIETLCADITALDPKADEDAGEKIVQDLTHLARLVHELRDAIESAMVTIMTCEDRIAPSDRRKHVDLMTGLRNRLGLEYQLRKWWREDPDRQRHLSLALVDFERLGKTNEFASTRVGDQILRALAQLFKQQASRDSGFERVFRYNGHQILVFFGDVGHSAAMATTDHIRQTVETTLFEYKGKQYSLTVRAGVSAARPEDDSPQLLQRLADLAAAAKQDGGNRTCTDEKSKIIVVQAAKKAPTPRTVTIE